MNSIFNVFGFVFYKFCVIRLRDFGFYSCVVENKMGIVIYYIEVYERGEFKFLKIWLIKVIYLVKKMGIELLFVLLLVLFWFYLLILKELFYSLCSLKKV